MICHIFICKTKRIIYFLKSFLLTVYTYTSSPSTKAAIHNIPVLLKRKANKQTKTVWVTESPSETVWVTHNLLYLELLIWVLCFWLDTKKSVSPPLLLSLQLTQSVLFLGPQTLPLADYLDCPWRVTGSRLASGSPDTAGTTAALSTCFNGDTAFLGTTWTAATPSACLDGNAVKLKITCQCASVVRLYCFPYVTSALLTSGTIFSKTEFP